jgi:putative DNA primase/helicase
MSDADTLANNLPGKKQKTRDGWMACCPAHDDRNPSLSISETSDAKVLVRCHRGCDQERVISVLRARGLWPEKGTRLRLRPVSRRDLERQVVEADTKRSAAALAIWRSAGPAQGTQVETYLGSRGLILPPLPNLCFHPDLKHPSGGIWPAMVALVTRGSDNVPLAIHRTFLARDGAGKAPVKPDKMMLGPCGGGAVRLADPTHVLMVGEGIETCLSVMASTGLPAWAALSTSGMRALDLPDEVREIILLADGDEPGERAAGEAGLRWKREGRKVRISRPPRGLDFNDILMGDREAGITHER